MKSDKKSSPKNQSQNGSNGETTIPNGFSDDISEIDGDIDMTTTTLPVPSVSRSEVSSNRFAFDFNPSNRLWFNAKRASV